MAVRRPKPHRKGPRPHRPQPAAPALPPDSPMLRVLEVARENPEGWALVAEAIRENEEYEPADLVRAIGQAVGKEALPLLAGLAREADDELAVAALQTLPLLGTRAAGEALAAAHAAFPDGERGLLAWQGVESLRARGINVSVPEPEGVRAAPAAFTIRESWEALPDGVGSRETVVRGQDPYGVWRSLIVVWNEVAGVKDAFALPVGREAWQEMLETQRRGGMELVQVPLEYAQHQIARARELNARSGFPLKESLKEWEELVGPPPAGYAPPDMREPFASLSDAELAERESHLACLLGLPSMNSWGVEPADVQPFHEEWRRLLAEAPEDSEEHSPEMKALLARAADAAISPELMERIRVRLLEAAYKLSASGRTHQAELAACSAIQIERASSPGQVELLRMLCEAGLHLLEELLEAGEDPEAMRYDPMSEVDNVGQHE